MNPTVICRRSGVVLAALALSLAGCSRSGPAGPVAAPPVPVQVAVAVQRDVPRAIDAIGNVQTLRNVAIKSQVDGIIAAIHFREGDDVKAGDLLVSLDQRPYENSLRIARADLANARAEAAKAATDLERYKHLDQQDAISKEQFGLLATKAETTKAQVQAKEAAVANAELLLGYTKIRAPIAGRTGQLVLHEGALVKANDNSFAIVTLNQLAPIAVTYSVPERSLDDIREALAARRATVTVTDRNTGLARDQGRLEFIDNTVDPATGMITLKAIFANEDQALWPGRFFNVSTLLNIDHAAVVVPASAVVTSQSGSTIYVLKSDAKVELRAVKVARTAGDLALIATGISAGETVVTDGQLRLVPGARAEARQQSGAPVSKGKTG